MPPDTPYRLFLLGRTEIVAADGSSVDALLAQPKLVALVARLALAEPGPFVRRDGVIGLLWPELDQEHARAALRKAVLLVRGAIGAASIAARGDEDIALAGDVVWCDVVHFAQQTERGHLAAALETYRGELMPGFHLSGCREFDGWLEQERTGAAERAAAAAWALAQRLEGSGKLTEAGTWVRRAARLSWSDERVLRRAMEMLSRLGDGTGALRVYDDFARRALLELEAVPSPETQRLAERLRGVPGVPPRPEPRR